MFIYLFISILYSTCIYVTYTGPTFAGQQFGARVSHVTFPCTQGHATERRLAGQDTTGKWAGSMHRVCQHKTYVQLDWRVGECAVRTVLLYFLVRRNAEICTQKISSIHTR